MLNSTDTYPTKDNSRPVTIERCQRCVGDQACQNQVVIESLPVAAFGDVSGKSVKAVTVGLNPALNEFFLNGTPRERSQRLAVLNDYSATNRVDLGDKDVDDAKARREEYFKNLDRGWHSYFENLESLVSRIHPAWSYILGRVVHIDLVACATRVRWGDLEGNCQTALLNNCRGHFLATLSKVPDGTLLLLDGARVMNEIRQLGLHVEQEGGDQLINVRMNRGWIGKLSFGGKVFPFRGWSTPVVKLTPPWRYDLAFWICGTLRPRTTWSGFAPC